MDRTMPFPLINELVRMALGDIARAYQMTIRTIRAEGPDLLLMLLVSLSCLATGLVAVLIWCAWAASIANQLAAIVWIFLALFGVIGTGLLSGYGTWKLWEKNNTVRKLFKEGAK
jgi:hypothetical protein